MAAHNDLGKWVIFSDADDYFLPSFDNILNENLTSNADILIKLEQ